MSGLEDYRDRFHSGRTPGEVVHERDFGALDRRDWPKVGDEVLYHRGDGSGWTAATVVEIAAHDGDLRLDVGDGVDALDAKHGPHRHGWLLYSEHARAVLTAATEEDACDGA